MAITKITPDGFPVNDVGRMTNMLGEPYYIEGWGLTASTLGPGEYSGYYDSDIIYGGSQDDYLHDLWELLERMLRRGREPEEPRQKTPDVVVQIEVVGGQSDKILDQPKTPVVLPQTGHTKSEESANKSETSGTGIERPGQGDALGNIGALPNMNLPTLGH